MEPKPIYFDRESPDFNMGLNGRSERLAANRVVLCLLTEFGLVNDARMQPHQVNILLESLQATTGTFKEPRSKVKIKDTYIKQRHSVKSVTSTQNMLNEHEHSSKGSLRESTF
jgi:hypothetical protein